MSIDTARQNGSSPTPQELEREVERNREELARTVDALHDKLDVKAQARLRVARFKDSATTGSGKPRPVVLGVTGAAVAGIVVLVWFRRR